MRSRLYENQRHCGGVGGPPSDCRPAVHGGRDVGGHRTLCRCFGIERATLEEGLENWWGGRLGGQAASWPAVQTVGGPAGTVVRRVGGGAQASGYNTDLWTCRRVAVVIQKRFGVSYHFNHVGRILHALGFSPQKPLRRARERDEEAIERWRREDWPRIKKRDADSKPASYFSMKPAFSCSR